MKAAGGPKYEDVLQAIGADIGPTPYPNPASDVVESPDEILLSESQVVSRGLQRKRLRTSRRGHLPSKKLLTYWKASGKLVFAMISDVVAYIAYKAYLTNLQPSFV